MSATDGVSKNHQDFNERGFNTHYDYVAVTTIDQIIKDLEIKTVDFIKMDIEFSLKYSFKEIPPITSTSKTTCFFSFHILSISFLRVP